jgi:hypothetical protein
MKGLRRAAGLVAVGLLIAACAGEPEQEATADGYTPAGEMPPTAELVAMADAARRSLEEYGVDARIDISQGKLVVSRKTREYMVYEREENGPWSSELVSIRGPEHDGILFTATVHLGRYDGAEDLRESRPNNYLLGRIIRGPYFNTYPSLTTLDLVDKHLICHISIGQQTDVRMIQAVHMALLEECRDRKWLTAPTPRP